MPNIVVDGRKMHSQRTGVGNYVYNIVSRWPSDGLTVLSSPPERAGGADSNRFGGVGGKLKALLWHVSAWRTARKEEAVYFSPESLLVPILYGRRSLLTVHDLTPFTTPHAHTWWNKLVHRFALALALARCGRVVVPTAAVRDDVLSRYPWVRDRLSVVTEGVRDVVHGLGESTSGESRSPYLLYVGTVEPRKNVVPLVRAFLKAARPGWRLVLVGRMGWIDPDERREFEQLVAAESVEYLGYVSDEILRGLYAGAAAFCYPSSAEGFGLPVAEAMAAGLVVIHTDDPALLEVGGGAGILVRREFLDEDLVRALRTVLDMTDEDRVRYSEAGRRAAAKFDWDDASRNTRQLLEQLTIG